MAKTSVSQKIPELVEAYRSRALVHLNEEEPDAGLFWSASVLALGELAQGMFADGQIHPDVYAEIVRHAIASKKVVRRLKGGVGENPSFSPAVVRAYNRFLEEWESGL
jgi:hypothetical protein